MMASNSNPPQEKKNKLVLVAGSSVVLVAMVMAVAVGVSKRGSAEGSSSNGDTGLSTTSKSIQSICQPTDYKEACESTLREKAGNETDTKKLVMLTFEFAIERLHYGLNHSALLQEAAKDPRTKAALEDCNDLLDYAIDELRASVDKFADMDPTQINEVIDDLRIWLSAAITYQQTCLDGFENKTGDAAEGMSQALNMSAALTSNTLAIVDQISAVLTAFQLPLLTRRLLVDRKGFPGSDFPSWFSGEKRRLLSLSSQEIKPNATVATDGSGTHKTITEALAAVPNKSPHTFVIYIKEGVYKETVMVEKWMTNVMMIGDGATKSKITGNLNYVDGVQTFRTATMGKYPICTFYQLNDNSGQAVRIGLNMVAAHAAAAGNGFIMKDLGVENSAGAEKHQAVALRVQSDKSVFYRCQFDGYQDTLYAHTKRQFYRECTVSGTIDFIFGDSAMVMQNCLLLVRKPLSNQQCIITAQGRKERHQASGIVLHNCTLSADNSLVKGETKSYIGRPWKEFSRTIVMQSQIDDLIEPEGWLPWTGDFGLNTCFYTEIDNRGPGAAMDKRVKWKGIKKVDLQHSNKYTVQHFIQGNVWLPATGVPFTSGLI